HCDQGPKAPARSTLQKPTDKQRQIKRTPSSASTSMPHDPAKGAETCSCTTNQPLVRFSRIMVQRASMCVVAPCLLVRSAPNVNVAQANVPLECTRRSSFILALMLLFGSKRPFCAPA